MPIYAYRCASCGLEKDVMRKISDPPLITCPACGADTFVKQLTAPGFQLKGSGWYVTDFKGGGAAKPADAAASTESAAAATKPTEPGAATPAAPAASAPSAASPATDA